MTHKIYLAGPITGKTFSEAVHWRDDMRMTLLQHGILAYCPLRGKRELARGNARDKITIDTEQKLEGALNTPRAIFVRDRLDCLGVDMLVCNFKGSTEISGGTIVEMALAYEHKIPICVIVDDDNSYYLKHPMCAALIDFIVYSIEDAVKVVLGVLQV